MDIEQARYNMVEQQIRPWEVLDQEVLNLLFQVKREDFVPEAYRSLAFVDMEIPLGHGEVMLSPKLEARMLQELAVEPTDRVLEIGTGSGYLTALLAKRAAHVTSVDIQPEFTAQAGAKLAGHGIVNVTLETGDASRGWDKHGPYDVIVVTGSLPVLPDTLAKQLAPHGRLLAVVGEAPVMEARLITCVMAPGVCRTTELFETVIPPLRNALQAPHFVF
jgi:protein-L-isoaspartate(D-aspartate) O-methyltransferase